MSENYGGPRIIPEFQSNPGNFFTIGEIADILAFPDQDKKNLGDKLRWFVNRGYITPDAKEAGGRQAFWFQRWKVILFDLLLTMQDMGIANADAAQAAARALEYWPANDKPEVEGAARSPGLHVILEYEVGKRDWAFELWNFVNPKNGWTRWEGRIFARDRGEGTNLLSTRHPETFVKRSVFAVDLTEALDRIHPVAKAKRKAMN